MSDDSGNRTVEIDEERLERVIEAVALASTGAFEEATARFGSVQQDSFGVIEEALRVFLMELKAAKEQSEQAVTELRVAKLDLEQKLDTIEKQQEAISELSAPIIDVWDDVLTLPLVGLIDTKRAVEMTDKLLHRIVESRAKWVLIDLTGVSVVDSMTADHLIKLAKAVQLIGCRCIVTGIGPEIAQTLVALNVSLGDLRPMRSLRQGLKYCIAARRAGVAFGGSGGR
ncbi:MAG TPA: STAS domain-containing protein [Polyangiaceae bacterium]|nr:STAS domain-containing protein [Polyangiaceae bacterium]